MTHVFFRLFIWFALAGAGFSSLQARAQAVDAGYAKVELLTERAVAMPGETIWLGLSFELDDEWHIYWKNPGDAGIPPIILWSDETKAFESQIGDFVWPVPELLPVVEGQIMDYGYSDEIVLPFQFNVPEDQSGPILFDGVADYLICKDICIPESAPISLIQSVGAGQIPDTFGAEKISAAIKAVPPALEGTASLTQAGEIWTLSIASPALTNLSEARFFPEEHEIVHAADQPVRVGPDGLQLDLTPVDAAAMPETLAGLVVAGDVAVEIGATPGPILENTGVSVPQIGISLAALVVLAILGGLILNLMPCVLPVLSIKAMGMVSAAANGKAGEARLHGLWYTAGVLVSFAVLAAAIIAVRSATGIATWGFWLQDPLFVTALILIIFLIGLWLLGLFELGASVQNVGSGLAAKQGPAGAFFTGVLAAVVGAPCTGPFLGAALGAVMARPTLDVFIVLLAMGLGLALPFLILSFMPRLQAMLPKPGAWMETLKQVFAFPMFLTAAWLLSVLGALAGYRTAAFVVAGAALIGFGIWALKAADQGGRAILISVLGLSMIVPLFGVMSALSAPGQIGALAIALLSLALLVAGIVIAARLPAEWAGRAAKGLAAAAIGLGLIYPIAQATGSQAGEGGSQAYSAKYETEDWSPARVAELVAEGRPVFVDFTAEWCATCQANKIQTLQTQAVTEAFAQANVAFLVADYTRPDPVIAAELQTHNRAGVPMYLWYPAGQATPQVLPEVLSISLVTGLARETGLTNSLREDGDSS